MSESETLCRQEDIPRKSVGDKKKTKKRIEDHLKTVGGTREKIGEKKNVEQCLDIIGKVVLRFDPRN